MRKVCVLLLFLGSFLLVGCDVNDDHFSYDDYMEMKTVEPESVLLVDEIREVLSKMTYPQEVAGFRYTNSIFIDGNESVYQDINIQKKDGNISALLIFRDEYDGNFESYLKDGSFYLKHVRGSQTTYTYQEVVDEETDFSYEHYIRMFEDEYHPSEFAPMSGDVTELTHRLWGVIDKSGNYVIDCQWLNGITTRIVLNPNFHVRYIYKISHSYRVDTKFIYQASIIHYPSNLDEWKQLAQESDE